MKTLCRFLLWLALLLAPWISYPPLACAQDAGDVSLPILFDQYGAVMLMLDADTGEIIDANQAALRFYGYSREKLLTMNIADINTLSPDQIANELNAVKTGQRNNFVFEHRLASGEIRSVEVYSYSVSVNGRMVMLSTVNDITDRLLLESNQAQLLMLRILVGCMLLAALLWVIRSRRKLKLANISMEKTNQLLKTFIDAQGDLVYMKDDQLRYVLSTRHLSSFTSAPRNRSSARMILPCPKPTLHSCDAIPIWKYSKKRRSSITRLSGTAAFLQPPNFPCSWNRAAWAWALMCATLPVSGRTSATGKWPPSA